MAYWGSCHCGAVKFSVEGDLPGKAISCNCSHCRRKGFLLTFVPRERFILQEGANHLTEYRFHKHQIAHQFCDVCGCQAFGEGEGPGGVKMAAVNLRCVPDADLDALEIEKVDGASF